MIRLDCACAPVQPLGRMDIIVMGVERKLHFYRQRQKVLPCAAAASYQLMQSCIPHRLTSGSIIAGSGWNMRLKDMIMLL